MVKDNITYDPLLPDEDGPFENQSSRKRIDRLRSPSVLLWALQALIFSTSAVLFFYAVSRVPGDAECSKILTPYSPLQEIPGLIEYSSFHLPLEFEEPSPYRGPPTPERESLWKDMWYMGSIDVPEAALGALNKSNTGKTWKRTPSGGVAALVEVFHQIHCVNVLRQWSYIDHFDGITLPVPEWVDDDPKITRVHLDHCIETLRYNLMCTADVTPLLVEVDPKSPLGEKADFETNHKCRNFQKIHDWVAENKVFS